MTQLKIKDSVFGTSEFTVQIAVDNVLNDCSYESGELEIFNQQIDNLIRVVSILCEILVESKVLNKDQLQSILGYKYKVE